MPALKQTIAAFVALAGMTGQLAAAPFCATDVDQAAFRTAAVQQQLMVAAFMCKDMDAYNRFVIAYQPELQKSDTTLKKYFIRGGHEAGYDTFKTKLANLSSLSSITNITAYCANAAAAFDTALGGHPLLASFVDAQPLMIAIPAQAVCQAGTIAAAATPATPPVRLASDDPAIEPTVAPAPSHALPASPYNGAR
jgi:hypothetical protein